MLLEDLEFTRDVIITIAIVATSVVIFCFCCGLYCCSEGSSGGTVGGSTPFGGIQGDFAQDKAAQGMC